MKELFDPTIEWFNGDFEDFIKVLDEYGSEPFAVSPGEDKFVYLNNSIWSGYWRIIGINHDGTSDTVDLMPTKIMGGRNRTSTGSSGCYDFSSNSQLYHKNNNSNDYLRYYIENDIVNGFDSAIQSRLTTFNYVCETSTATGKNVSHTYTTYSAKACPLSWTEIGAQAANINNWNQYTGVEGTIYEYFTGAGSGDSRLALTDGITTRDSSYLGYWGLRSRYTNGASCVIYVNLCGYLNYIGYSHALFGAVPRIRFKRQKNNDKPEIHRIKVKSALKYPDCAVKINKPKDINSGREWLEGDFENFIKVLDKYGSAPFAVTAGQDKFVYLENSIWSGYWRIIGINHDNTEDTVDLIPTKIMGGRNRTSTSSSGCYDFSSNSQLYHYNNNSNDYLRYYIENDIVNGFSTEIRNRLTNFNYVCETSTATGKNVSHTYTTYSAKAVALSYTEIGWTASNPSSYNQYTGVEGTIYEYFTGASSGDSRLALTDGVTTRNSSYLGNWGLRSRITYSTSYVIHVNSSGILSNDNYNDALFGAVPRIRFERRKNNDKLEIYRIIKVKVKSDLKYPDCAVKINKPKDINSGREWFSGDFEDFIKVLDEYGSKPFAVSPGEDKFVYLTNSIWSGNWRVIGINHDGTSDTVDLMPTKIMGGRNRTSDYFTDCYDFSSNSQLYHKNGNSNDYLRYYIENDIVNGFDSNIRNRLTTFNYTCSEGTGTGTTGGSSDTIKTYSAKAVALSWTEVGGKESATNYCPKAEGTKYEFFSSSKTAWSTFGTDLDLKMTDGVTTRYSGFLGLWGLRSRNTYGASVVNFVASGGNLDDNSYNYANFGAVPRIRFKRQKNNDNPEIHKINGSKDLKSNKKLKMMISQPMSGREEDVIRKERDEIAEKYIFSEGLELVDTFFMDEAPEGTKNPHIFYLARALKEMANADGVIFAPGWRKARGCIIEYEVAKKYGLYIKDLEAR